MKKFKDLAEGDKLYEVFSDKLITHEVSGNASVEKATFIPIKDKRGVYVHMLPKICANKTAYEYPNIYRAVFTSLDEAKMGLKTHLEKFKERTEWRIRDIKNSLEREEARLLHIVNDLQNIDNLQD